MKVGRRKGKKKMGVEDDKMKIGRKSELELIRKKKRKG